MNQQITIYKISLQHPWQLSWDLPEVFRFPGRLPCYWKSYDLYHLLEESVIVQTARTGWLRWAEYVVRMSSSRWEWFLITHWNKTNKHAAWKLVRWGWYNFTTPLQMRKSVHGHGPSGKAFLFSTFSKTNNILVCMACRFGFPTAGFLSTQLFRLKDFSPLHNQPHRILVQER